MILRVFFISATLLLPASQAQARTLKEACERLTYGSQKEAKKCVDHAHYFEVSRQFVDACADFHKDSEIRTRCLKSGADLGVLELCRSTGWALANTLTCLRTYPSRASLKACQQLSNEENDQLRCLRMGREAAQIQTCLEISSITAFRLRCLEMNIPVLEAKRCVKKFKGEQSRIQCLENIVADREKEYRRSQLELRKRDIASQPD